MDERALQRRIYGGAALVAAAALALAGTAPAAAATSADQDAVFDFSDPAAATVLVNGKNPLDPLDYVPADLTPAGGSENLMAPEAAVALAVLLEHAAADGHRLMVESAYRSHSRQDALYRRYVARYGEAYASTISAKPGTSEHQLGLAADVGLASGECSLERCFGDTPAGRWIDGNAGEFGFIVRYPDGQEDVTGYKYEPWHLRYIGTTAVAAMAETGAQTFEEFAAAVTVEGAGEVPGSGGTPSTIARPEAPSLDWYPKWSLRIRPF